jgi:hypothetical protein
MDETDFINLRNQLYVMEGRFDAMLGHLIAMQERLNPKIEKVETALLTEFHKWASPADMRVRSHAAAIKALEMEMENLSDRVEKLEGAA